MGSQRTGPYTLRVGVHKNGKRFLVNTSKTQTHQRFLLNETSFLVLYSRQTSWTCSLGFRVGLKRLERNNRPGTERPLIYYIINNYWWNFYERRTFVNYSDVTCKTQRLTPAYQSVLVWSEMYTVSRILFTRVNIFISSSNTSDSTTICDSGSWSVYKKNSTV